MPATKHRVKLNPKREKKSRARSIVTAKNNRPLSKSVAQAFTKFLRRDDRCHRVQIVLNDDEKKLLEAAAKRQDLAPAKMFRASAIYGLMLYLDATEPEADDE